MKRTDISPCFVEFIPEQLDEGIIYVSEKYQTAIHKCCCGCGEEVVTPLNPADWRLRKGKSGGVSLWPSIGNWNFACQSHYWIRENKVEWARQFTKKEIRSVQERDLRSRRAYIAEKNAASDVSGVWLAITTCWDRLRGR